MEQTLSNNINSVIDYQKIKNYDTKEPEPINFNKLIDILKNKAVFGDKIIHGFADFQNNVLLMGARTTLDDELKISNTEALNYLMGLPLNFNLEPFMRLFYTQLISLDEKELRCIDILKFNFDKKKKLIKQNFESTTHIDVQEFKDWAKSRGFIKNKPFKVIKKPKMIR